jgi:hypothetical protein
MKNFEIGHFWKFKKGWSKMEHPGKSEITGSLFCGPNKGFIRVFLLGFWNVGPWVYP